MNTKFLNAYTARWTVQIYLELYQTIVAHSTYTHTHTHTHQGLVLRTSCVPVKAEGNTKVVDEKLFPYKKG